MKKVHVILASLCAAVCALSSCGGVSDPTQVTVCMPDGAPALALASVMKDDTDTDGITYKVIDTSTSKGVQPLLAQLTNADKEKNADFCVLPLSVACTEWGTATEYVMLGLVTQGNLYLVSQNKATYTKANIADLCGKTVLVKQMAAVPGLTLKAALSRSMVQWTEYVNEDSKASDKVNLAKTAATYDMELLAEPAVSKRLAANTNLRVVGDLQELYGDGGLGQNGYPQAVLVVKKSFLQENGDWTKTFVQKIINGHTGENAWLYTAQASAVYDAVSAHFYETEQTAVFSAQTLSVETRRRCGVQFTYAAAAKTAVENYLTETGVALPSAEFYWEYQA